MAHIALSPASSIGRSPPTTTAVCERVVCKAWSLVVTVLFMALDVRSESNVEKVMDQVVSRHCRLDVLVIGAGEVTKAMPRELAATPGA